MYKTFTSFKKRPRDQIIMLFPSHSGGPHWFNNQLYTILFNNWVAVQSQTDRPQHAKTHVFYKTDHLERSKTHVFYKTDRPDHAKTHVLYTYIHKRNCNRFISQGSVRTTALDAWSRTHTPRHVWDIGRYSDHAYSATRRGAIMKASNQATT